jgi:methylamine dehydrogenase accessory protein MauD
LVSAEVLAMEGWWAASYVVLWLVVVVLCTTVVALARQVGTLHLRLGPRGALELDDEGPPLGGELDPVELADLNGDPVTIAAPGETQLLLFVSPGCSVCEQVLPAVAAVADDGGMAPYVLSDAGVEDTARTLGGRRLRAPLVPAAGFARSLEVPGTPYALVLDPAGVVRAKGTANNLEQVEGLADTARRRLRAAFDARAA